MRTELGLTLYANTDSLIFPNAGPGVLRDVRDGIVCQFDLLVTPDCPNATFELVLMAEQKDVGDIKKIAATLSVTITGGVPIVIGNYFRLIQINPTAAPLERVAVLHVTPQDDKWTLEGWNRRSKQLEELSVPRPESELTPAWLDNLDDHYVDQVWDAFQVWSTSELVKFRKWVRGLWEEHGDDLVLAIIAKSDSDFPWELVYVYIPEFGGDVPLGAVVTTVRWMFVSADEGTGPGAGLGTLGAEGHEDAISKGRVISYVDPSPELPGTDRELKALKRFDTRQCDSLKSLRAAMLNGIQHTGLVFVGCHGTYPDNKRDEVKGHGSIREVVLAGGDEELPAAALSSMPYLDWPNRPLVFFNACHSGRLLPKRGVATGFVIPILQRMARAYIGAIGEVNSELAGRLTAQLLEASTSTDPRAEVARCLRNIRREEFIAWKTSKGTDWERIHAFFYVYFGNPFLTLQLDAPPGKTNDE